MPNAGKKRDEVKFETLVHGPDRLSLARINAMSEADRVEYLNRRRAFLNEWFALIELGVIESTWSTFAQRLDYVLEQTDLDQKGWAKSAKIQSSILSMYLKRKRGQVNQPANAETLPLCKNVLALIRAAKNPAELPWVLGGSSTSDSRTFRERIVFTLKMYFGNSSWRDNARGLGINTAILDESIGKEGALTQEMKQLWVANVSKEIGTSIISADWLLFGKTEPPEKVLAAMQRIAAEGPVRRWDAKLDDHVQVMMPGRELVELLKLFERHVDELPADVGSRIRQRLFMPLAFQVGPVMAPTLIAKDPNDHLSEDQIRERRRKVFYASRGVALPPDLQEEQAMIAASINQHQPAVKAPRNSLAPASSPKPPIAAQPTPGDDHADVVTPAPK